VCEYEPTARPAAFVVSMYDLDESRRRRLFSLLLVG